MGNEINVSKNEDVFGFQENIDSEMRDMLSIILPAVKLAQKTRWSDEADIEKTKTYLKAISKASYNMLRTLNNAADCKALKNGEMTLNISSCDIVSLLREIVITVSETVADKKISFSLLTDSESKQVSCDCEKTERIILNILSNAIANTVKGGAILLCLKDENESWELIVTDTGHFTGNEQNKSILKESIEKEYSGSRRLCGIGMGLYLAGEFARIQKGSLSVSENGKRGCRFVFKMPTNYKETDGFHENIIPEYSDYSFEQKVMIELSYLNEE